MNEDKLSNAMKDIQKVLDKLAFHVTNDPEEDKMFVMGVEIATTDGIIELVGLYVTVQEDYAPAHEKEKPFIISMEVGIPYELDDNEIIKALELINLINRQAIVGHLLVNLADKTISLKKDIRLLKGRLSRVELEWSINALLANAAFYYPLIVERVSSVEALDDMSKKYWADSSYLHKGCRSDEQVKP